MSSDALIDQLAPSRFYEDYGVDEDWSRLSEADRQDYRDLVREHDLPVVVSFVEAWLEDKDCEGLASIWCREMT